MHMRLQSTLPIRCDFMGSARRSSRQAIGKCPATDGKTVLLDGDILFFHSLRFCCLSFSPHLAILFCWLPFLLLLLLRLLHCVYCCALTAQSDISPLDLHCEHVKWTRRPLSLGSIRSAAKPSPPLALCLRHAYSEPLATFAQHNYNHIDRTAANATEKRQIIDVSSSTAAGRGKLGVCRKI